MSNSFALRDMPPHTSGIANALVQASMMTAEDAVRVAQKAHASDVGFVEALMTVQPGNAADFAVWASRTFGVALLDLDAVPDLSIDWDAIKGDMRRKHKVIPLYKRGKKLVVATADPADAEVENKLKFATSMAIEFVVVEYDKIDKRLKDGHGSKGSTALSSEDFDMAILEGSIDSAEVTVDSTENLDEERGDDAPLVQYVNRVISDAIAMGASDMHFEPFETFYQVRFRIDGVLEMYNQQPPVAIKDRLASRVKVVAKLDIAEKRVPQDGRMRMTVGGKRIDFRVSTLPVLHGEKIVVRVLDSSAAKVGIDALGYEPEEKERLLEAIKRPYGMVLVTGPTGSGKTVSLYSCLNLLNQPGVNISTAEDPAEINLAGVNQVNVNDKAGLTFSAALKAFLRQDPDIIMVGEIRDLETADIAIKAAQTGHMVFSTLHTNDAPTTLTRMMNMGVAPFNIASSVILITAQRLARKLCNYCKVAEEIEPQALLEAGFHEADLDGSWKPYKAVGCSRCNKGYKGRVGIYQVMPISEEIQRIILTQGTAMDIAKQASLEGVRTLRESGLVKVKLGVTSLEEVLGVTNE